MKIARLLRLLLLTCGNSAAVRGAFVSISSGLQAGGVRGHTPHEMRFVKVAPGVELEVLDWGGTGKAMVLLTGLRRQRARLRPVRVPVHRLLSRHRDHPPRISCPRASRGTATTFRPGRRTTSRCSMPWASTRPYSSGIPLPARN